MPSEPQKKEIHIDGNVTNSNIIIGDKNAVSQASEVSKPKFLLRLKQHIEKEDAYRIEIEFDDDGTRQTPEARFEFKMTARICAGIWRIIFNIRSTLRRRSRNGSRGVFGIWESNYSRKSFKPTQARNFASF